MRWPYHFVDLTESQIQQRRFLLDNYGQFAQLSVLLLPLLYQLFSCVRLIGHRLQNKAQYRPLKARQSPTGRHSHSFDSSLSRFSRQRVHWWLDDEIAPGWGSRKQWLSVAIWTSWLSCLVTKDTGADYLHVTKRFGIVAASQLPIQYLLAAKGWSPVQFLTRMSHEELNAYHRLFGRIILTFCACHAALYMNFFIQKGLLLKRVKDWDVLLGLTAISAATVLFTTSLAKLRDYSYRLFFYLHVFLTLLLLPVLYMHVSHLRVYILEAAVIYGVIILQRNLAEAKLSGTITRVPRSNLLSIAVTAPSPYRFRNFTPGQHIYIGFPSLIEKLRKNPFTIANVPNVADSKIELYVRSIRGTTQMLDDLAAQPQPVPLTIEGPYGSSANFPQLENFDCVLLVAGGIGATFTLPIYSQLRKSAGPTLLKFVWTVKTLDDAIWGINAFLQGPEEQSDTNELYVTSLGTTDSSLANTQTPKDALDNQTRDGIELEDMHGSGFDSKDWEHLRRLAKPGRPKLSAIVDEIFEQDRSERVAVLVCGPPEMGRALRQEVGRYIDAEHDVFWHNEEFGW